MATSFSSVVGSDVGDVALVRYNQNGTLDSSFGQAGKVTTAFPGYGFFANTVALQADGGIVVGSAAGPLTNANGIAFALARYLPGTTQITGQATQLVLTTKPPASVMVDSSFGLTVKAEDAGGNVVTSYTGPVTLTLSSNPGNAAFRGTTTVTARGGVATFSGLSLSVPGNGYTLQATATGLTGATTTGVKVTPRPLTVVSTTTVHSFPSTSTGMVVLATFALGGSGKRLPLTAYSASINWEDGSPVDSSAGPNVSVKLNASGTRIIISGKHSFAGGGGKSPQVTLRDTEGAIVTAKPTIDVAIDVSKQVSVVRSGLIYNQSTQLFSGTLTLANTSSTTLTGPLQVVLTGLPPGVTLANSSGSAAGNPFLTVKVPGGVLQAGKSVKVAISFRNPKHVSFSYQVDTFVEG